MAFPAPILPRMSHPSFAEHRSLLHASLLAALAALLLAACAGAPGVRQLPEEARQAEQMYRDGEFSRAAEGFLAAAAGHRANRDYFRLRAAEALREEGELDAAERALAGIDPRALDDDERQRLLLLQAELALAAGRPQLALERLSMPAQRLPAHYRARLHELRGRAFEADGDGFSAALEYVRLDPLLEPREQHDNAERLRSLLDRLADHELLQRSAALPPGHPLQPFAARALGARGLAVPTHFRDYPDRYPGPAMRAPRPRIVALLLPQDGPLRVAANSVRDGIMAAHYGTDGPRPELRSYDTGSTPEQAIEAYRRAVAEGAEAVVGPLSREAVSALLAEPRLPVPVLALNRPSGPVPLGSISFALAPEDEAAAVARRMAERGLRRVIAVVGSDEHAQRALAGFTARHLQAGGELLGTVIVPDVGVDYLDPIRRTLQSAGLPISAPRELAEAHNPGFDAVFLALRAPQARLAVPQLRMFGITRLPILATSTINEVGDGDRLDRDLNGIEFTEVPWLVADLPGLPSRAALIERLDSTRGGGGRLFAFGLDAYRLLLERATLESGEGTLDGATGQIRLDRYGEARRQPGIAVFRNQRPRLLVNGGLLSDGESAR
jgi:uncharacterized protein